MLPALVDEAQAGCVACLARRRCARPAGPAPDGPCPALPPLCCACPQWAVVMSRGAGYLDQVVELDFQVGPWSVLVAFFLHLVAAWRRAGVEHRAP